MQIDLVKARKEYLACTVSTYGLLRKYAEQLTERFGDKWWEIPMKGPVASDNMKKLREDIRAEKAEVQKLAEEKKKANPKYNIYKPWSDVLAYVKPEKKKGAGSNAPREIYARLEEELAKLYKAINLHDDADEAALSQCAFKIGEAMVAIGVNLGPINEDIESKRK